MQRLLILFLLLFRAAGTEAQTFVETNAIYPVNLDGNKYVVSGFTSFEALKDETIFANALLWTVENVCPKLQEGITRVDVPGKGFTCDFILNSFAGSSLQNVYYCRAVFRVADGKLVYYLSDVLIESASFVMKKVTPLDKLNPGKKASHKQTMDDFIQTESLVLNKMFDFIASNQLSNITHWKEIGFRKPVEGMNEDECRLAFGKPQTVLEANGEIQWMYSSSFHLFFKDGRVCTILK